VADELQQARQLALQYLARADRSAQQVRQRLERAADAVRTRSLQQAEVADMLNRLAERDAVLQQSWTRD